MAYADEFTVTIPDGVGLCIGGDAGCYDPTSITVSEGDTVTWKNQDSATPLHTVSSGTISDDDAGSLFDSGFLSEGDTFGYTFDEAGEYPYFCLLHPLMTGTVIVEASRDGDSPDRADEKTAVPNPEPATPETETAPTMTREDKAQDPVRPVPIDMAGDSVTVAIPDGTGLCNEEGAECYDPVKITVSKGDTVTWENLDASTPLHTVSSGAISDDDAGALFDSGFIGSGDTFEYTFDEAGEYPYFCMLHPRMIGTVIVEGDYEEDSYGRTGEETLTLKPEPVTPGADGSPTMTREDKAQDPVRPVPTYMTGNSVTVAIPDGTGLCNGLDAMCYDPADITVAKGTTVTWENLDDSTPLHTVSSGAISDNDAGSLFDSGFIGSDETFEYTFDEEGEYPYFCMLHPRMIGTVTVGQDYEEDYRADVEETPKPNPAPVMTDTPDEPTAPENEAEDPAPVMTDTPDEPTAPENEAEDPAPVMADTPDEPTAPENETEDPAPVMADTPDEPSATAPGGEGICNEDSFLFPFFAFLFC